LNRKSFLCIHGHFYQPPRENAWTNEIETQPSAAPFHDWNERILQESYKPNSEAVIVDKHDTVINRINNYEYFNFNFGPTLLHWIRNKHPKTYGKILEADENSLELNDGHGNAIAMIYNHIIMPLANKRDKITQIKWALEDFKLHFGRESEGIWLPETACNKETLEALIEENVGYTILDPSQAHSVRKIDSENDVNNDTQWTDVSNGSINTQIPYRYFSETNPEEFINIIFYDGPLSKNIAFDDHIYSADKLFNRIKQVPLNEDSEENIISVGVDGETFGHHKRYTERTLSYLFSEILPSSEFQITNFGKFLSDHEPVFEVKIKDGPEGEGTSWSCLHGVGRWKENCGCGRTDEFPSQEWRKPLRESLNFLRDEHAELFENTGSHYLNDVWDARNDYIKLVFEESYEIYLENKKKFFKKHSSKKLSEQEKDLCIKLLEMQRYSMLMFTSCGWFFSDISGIETIQILEYAARSIEISKEITGIDIEKIFLEMLSEAKSNKKEFENGKDLYLKKIRKP
jgi:alpha-amylase/alpha-mannosidase (GH57 family)